MRSRSIEASSNELSLTEHTDAILSTELRYTPLRIVQLRLAKWVPTGYVVLMALGIFVFSKLSQDQLLSMHENAFAIIIGTVASGIALSRLANLKFREHAGRIRIDRSGLCLQSATDAEKCLLPWKDIISVTARGRTLADNTGVQTVVFLFNNESWSKSQVDCAKIWGTTVGTNQQQVVIDLRAIAVKDHSRLRTAIGRYIPTNKLDEQLQQKSVTAQESYTQLWLQSLGNCPRRLSAARLEPGSFLDDQRYEIVRTIASGGQGTAYAAIDHQANTGEPSSVVLKEFVVPAHGAIDSVQEMFFEVEQLANLLGRIASPQIVKLYRTFTDDLRLYLVLELVEGQTLRQLIKTTGPLAAEQILPIAAQLCQILTHLHEQNPPVIHRDFAPDNVILSNHGQLKLIDFDVALEQATDGSSKVVGKPSYIAPEQFRGQPQIQSDLYSLGATIYFLMTGKDPLPVSTSQLPEAESSVYNTLAAVVERCTQLELSSRYQSAREISKELASING